MSQTPSPEQQEPSHDQIGEQETSPGGELEIGPGGVIIADSPNNRELLERIEQTAPLSPIELYALALSYQETVPNSDLGNRLGFIGLSTIFQNPQRSIPELYPQDHETLRIMSNFSRKSHLKNENAPITVGARCWWDCDVTGYKNLSAAEQKWVIENGCPCAPPTHKIALLKTARLVEYNGIRLVIESTQAEERIIYVILGVGPSYLGPR